MDPITAGLLLAILNWLLAGITAPVVAVWLLRKYPAAFRWLKRRLVGWNILVVGHSRAGKTTFYYYLSENLFADTHPHPKTTEVTQVGSMSVGKGGAVRLNVSSGLDVPGDLPIAEQIDIVRRKRPEVVLAILSACCPDPNVPPGTAWLPAAAWLTQFACRLSELLKKDRTVAKRLRCLMVVYNKTDLVDEATKRRVGDELLEVVRKELGPLLELRTKDVKVLACTMRRDCNGELALNTIIVELIECLRNRSPLAPLPRA